MFPSHQRGLRLSFRLTPPVFQCGRISGMGLSLGCFTEVHGKCARTSSM